MAAIVKNQLSRDDALRLFDYRDGTLFWRHHASGRRADLRAVTQWSRRGKPCPRIVIGGSVFQAKYVVWNWHYGSTERMLKERDGNPSNISVDNLMESDATGNFIVLPSYSKPATTAHDITCPCCRQGVDAPSLDVLVMAFGISPFQERILDCLWRAKGRPVQKDRIIYAMYADDPDGGPSDDKATAAMKEAIFRMRDKLSGSGVSIEYDTTRKGYRLKIETGAPKPQEPQTLRMTG